MALTSEFVRDGAVAAPEGRDPRLAVEWNRPRPAPGRAARPLAIIVPWHEVLDRDGDENDEVMWTVPPPERTCVHFDVVYIPANMPVTGHPGARSMGTSLVGEVVLANGERVFVTAIVREMNADLRANVDRLRRVRILDTEGNQIRRIGMLGFGTEANPDADDGTEVARLIDVTRPDE